VCVLGILQGVLLHFVAAGLNQSVFEPADDADGFGVCGEAVDLDGHEGVGGLLEVEVDLDAPLLRSIVA